MLLADFLGPDDVRQLNLDLLNQKPSEYNLKSRSGSPTDSRSVEQRIRNVRAAPVRRVIEAIPIFGERALPAAWAHFVCLIAGRHLWPDANHRTGVLAFSLATERAFGTRVFLRGDDALALVRQRKEMRDGDVSRRGRYYTIDELARPDHPYRRIFNDYEDRLSIKRAR